MKRGLFLSNFLILIFFYNHFFSQTSWNNKLVGLSEVFVENLGQFNFKKNENQNTLFTLKKDGLEYNFHANGYTIIKKEWKKPKKSILKKKDQEDEDRNLTKNHLIQEVKFTGCNSNVKIIPSEKLDYTFSYSVKHLSKVYSIKANSYKKIIYKNLFNNIDLVFEIPKDSLGIKYSFILNPGSNPTDIEIYYPNTKNFKLVNDNLELQSCIGTIIENKPHTFFKKKS